MSWEIFGYCGQTAVTIILYLFLFGAGVTGLVFVGAFLIWLYEKAKRELYD